jgi:NitT/TauT family transport system substrate-binding protein
VGVGVVGRAVLQNYDPPPQPSPTTRAFTPVFDGLWGEGVRSRALLTGLLLFLGWVLSVNSAPAAETLRVGKAVGVAFSFVPLDIGIRKGLFAREGLEIEPTVFGGDARLQQAMAADGIDVALGSGPAMAFIAKGAPIKGIAAMAGPPLLLTVIVRPDGPKSLAELRGKTVSVSSAGSLTYWLVSETSRQQGWGPNGIKIATLGAPQAQYVALERGDTDGMVADLSSALDMEGNGKARILMRFGDLVKDFHIHVIFATDRAIAARPQALRGFLRAWFATIAFMRTNRAETVAIAQEVMGKDAAIMGRTYDELMPMFSDDGKFSAPALAVLAKSYVTLDVLPAEPDMTKLYTEAFLPKKTEIP